jgi:hypothetical protein
LQAHIDCRRFDVVGSMLTPLCLAALLVIFNPLWLLFAIA